MPKVTILPASAAARPARQVARKASRIENDVVGGQSQHHRLRIAFQGDGRGSGDCRPGIAPQRLDHDGGLDANLLGLAAGEKVEIRPGNHDGGGKHRVAHPQQGLLIGRALAHQRQELLGQGVARDRPQPGPGAAG